MIFFFVFISFLLGTLVFTLGAPGVFGLMAAPIWFFNRQNALMYLLTFLVFKNFVATILMAVWGPIIHLSHINILIFLSIDLLLIMILGIKYRFNFIFKLDMIHYFVFLLIAIYFVVGAITFDLFSALIYFRAYIVFFFLFAFASHYINEKDFKKIITNLSLSIFLYILFEYLMVIFGNEYFFNNFLDFKYWNGRERENVSLHYNLTSYIYNRHYFRFLGPTIGPTTFGYIYAYLLSAIFLIKIDSFAAKVSRFLIIVAATLLAFFISKGCLVIVLFINLGVISIRVFGFKSIYLASAITFVTLLILSFIGGTSAYTHALGLQFGILNFIGNPIGSGIGAAGNLSQSVGGVISGNESAVGVGLTTMGILFVFMLICIFRMAISMSKSTDIFWRILGLALVGHILNSFLQEESLSVIAIIIPAVALGIYHKKRKFVRS